MITKEFFNKFLFYHYHQLNNSSEYLNFGRDYWVDDKIKRGSSKGKLLTLENFMGWYLKRKDKGRCWVSISYYATYIEDYNIKCKPVFYDRIVYDLDIPFKKERLLELREKDFSLYREWFMLVKKETYRLCYHLNKRYNATPIPIFTGNRGYQIHVLLAKPLEAKHYSYVWDILKAGFEETKIPEGLKEETAEVLGENIEFGDIIDKNVRDSARLVRLPYTRHEKTGSLALVLDWKSLKELKMSEAIKLLDRRLDTSLIEKLLNISVSGEFVRVKRAFCMKKRLQGGKGKYQLPEDPKAFLESDHCPPCIKIIWEKFKAKIEVSHLERLAVLWYLLNLGYRPKEVIEIFKLLPDYDDHKTQYQVNYAYKRRYKMFNCETMQKRGLANEELCARCSVRERGYKNPLCWRFLFQPYKWALTPK